MKLIMNKMKLKDEKKKLEEKIYNIKQIIIHMIFINMKQSDLLVIVFIMVQLV